MAEELRRFLANEPIQARRTSQLERVRLWSRRNPAVASLLGIVFLLLICLTAGSLVAALGLKAAEEHRTEQLYQSLFAQANASRFSRQVGQRYGTLEAVRRAAQLVRERHMPAERLDELRNLAIAALALPDFRTLRTWEGFPGGTHAWNADDQMRRYARGDVDGNISLRWIDTDEEIARLEGWRGEYGLHFSPGGRFLVAWPHFRSRFRVWDVSATPPRIVKEGEQYGFTIHPDGKHLLVNQGNGSLLVYDLDIPNGKPSVLATLRPSSRSFAYDTSGKRLAIVGNGKVQILNAKTGQEEIVVPESQPSETAAWHPSGNYLALVCSGHDIHVWDLKRMKVMSILKGCRNGGVYMAFTPDGERLLTGGWEGIVRLWDWRTGRQVLQLAGDPRFPCRADERLLIHEGNRLSLVELNTGREYRSFVQQSKAGDDVGYRYAHIHPEGQVVVVAMSDAARLFDLQSGEELASLPVPGYGNHFPDNEVLLTSGAGCLLRWPIQADQDHPNRWRLGPPKLLHSGTGSMIGCDKKGSVIGQAKGMGAFLVRPGKGITLLGPHADCRNVAISPDGKYAATSNHLGDVGIKIWETDTGKLVVRFPLGGSAFAAFSPDGQWLLVAGSRGCNLVKVGTWEERPFDSIGIFSPADLLLAIPAKLGVIRLLELATDRELARLADPNQDAPNFLAFTPDGGKLLVSSDFARAFHVWDLRAIRAQLAEMGLDWDAPPLPPAPPISPEPIQIQVDLGNFQKLAEAASLVELAGRNLRGNRYKDALTALLKAVQLAPDFAPPHNTLAWLLETGPKEVRDPAQALVEARKAVELEPWQWPYINTLGVALYRSGKLAEAVPLLERSLREGKGQADAFDLFFLAMCHHRLGDTAKAKECRDRAVDWSKKNKGQISARWVRELTEFQAEAESVLSQPPGKARE
jgi:WD40 repeat protein/Tfp pilus assembly protein PilF